MTGFDLALRSVQYAILATAMLGALASAYVLADYVDDLLDLRTNGDYRMTAVIGIRTSAMLAFVFLLFLVFAIFAVLGPLPTPERQMRALISMGIFEIIVLALTMLKLLNLRDRVRLRRGKLAP